jgi:hypothetical protein
VGGEGQLEELRAGLLHRRAGGATAPREVEVAPPRHGGARRASLRLGAVIKRGGVPCENGRPALPTIF